MSRVIVVETHVYADAFLTLMGFLIRTPAGNLPHNFPHVSVFSLAANAL